jgi:hypothetical protein
VEIIPKAVKAIENQLDQGNGNLGLKFLQLTGVLKAEAEIGAETGTTLTLGNLPQTDELAVENSGRRDLPNQEAEPIPPSSR